MNAAAEKSPEENNASENQSVECPSCGYVALSGVALDAHTAISLECPSCGVAFSGQLHKKSSKKSSSSSSSSSSNSNSIG